MEVFLEGIISRSTREVMELREFRTALFSVGMDRLWNNTSSNVCKFSHVEAGEAPFSTRRWEWRN